MGLEPGEKMQFVKHQFEVFISGIMSIPIKIPGSKFYRSLQVKLNLPLNYGHLYHPDLLTVPLFRNLGKKENDEACQ